MEGSHGYQETVDTDTFHPRDELAGDRAEVASQVLPLPAPGPAAGGGPQLGLGEAVQMDHLGPMVVGEDGSLSRIANWSKLTDREREVALRRITARNRERLAVLRRVEAGQAELAAAGSTAAGEAAGAAPAGGGGTGARPARFPAGQGS